MLTSREKERPVRFGNFLKSRRRRSCIRRAMPASPSTCAISKSCISRAIGYSYARRPAPSARDASTAPDRSSARTRSSRRAVSRLRTTACSSVPPSGSTRRFQASRACTSGAPSLKRCHCTDAGARATSCSALRSASTGKAHTAPCVSSVCTIRAMSGWRRAMKRALFSPGGVWLGSPPAWRACSTSLSRSRSSNSMCMSMGIRAARTTASHSP